MRSPCSFFLNPLIEYERALLNASIMGKTPLSICSKFNKAYKRNVGNRRLKCVLLVKKNDLFVFSDMVWYICSRKYVVQIFIFHLYININNLRSSCEIYDKRVTYTFIVVIWEDLVKRLGLSVSVMPPPPHTYVAYIYIYMGFTLERVRARSNVQRRARSEDVHRLTHAVLRLSL